MISGDDPTPWNLLHDGTIVRLERDLADEVSVWIDVPYIRARIPDAGGTLFRFRLAACSELEYTPYDEPPITELAAIASSEPSLVEAQQSRGGRIVVWGSAGVLKLQYASLALELDTGREVPIDELRGVVRAYWDDWRKSTAPLAHPAIRSALENSDLRAALPALVVAWRTDRTSELAKAIEIIDERVRGPAPARLDGVDSFDAWIATWSSDLGAALAELVRRAAVSWDELLAELDRLAARSSGLRGSLPRDAEGDARAVDREALWTGFSRCLEALRSADPDPRIGRAVEDLLRGSPSEHWFRGDQVHHAVMSVAKPSDLLSFADHALALLDTHADAGTANRLDEMANRMANEADCIEAEMVDALRALAGRIAPRHPEDKKLPDAIATLLRNHAP